MNLPNNPDGIRRQYETYPYPSPADEGRCYPELANLVKLFELDSGYKLNGKRVLDVGTGTGVRLLELAKTFPQNEFLGIDMSQPAIDIADSLKSTEQGENVTFRKLDAARLNTSECGKFDVIFCMGVLHHLSDPSHLLRQLAPLLNSDGGLFFYVYGKYGSAERMRRKRILQHLHGEQSPSVKISTAKLLGMTDFPYGWELRSQRDMDAMIVDAYINEYEVLYELEQIDTIVPADVFSSWIPYGFTLSKSGLLVDSRLGVKYHLPLKRTNPKGFLPSPALLAEYANLSVRRRLLLLEDWYEPGGYTVLLHHGGLLRHVRDSERFTQNAWSPGERVADSIGQRNTSGS